MNKSPATIGARSTSAVPLVETKQEAFFNNATTLMDKLGTALLSHLESEAIDKAADKLLTFSSSLTSPQKRALSTAQLDLHLAQLEAKRRKIVATNHDLPSVLADGRSVPATPAVPAGVAGKKQDDSSSTTVSPLYHYPESECLF